MYEKAANRQVTLLVLVCGFLFDKPTRAVLGKERGLPDQKVE
jgi:hypothetical protein